MVAGTLLTVTPLYVTDCVVLALPGPEVSTCAVTVMLSM